MSIQGNLDTMSLPDILQWAARHSETGVFELERNKICKRIAFRKGRVVGCSSDDPPSRIGQFLLSRGKINRGALAKALEHQKTAKKNLGMILQDMGEITAEEFDYELRAKAEENIYSLFDWTHAVFRFKPGEPDDPWMLDYHAPLEEILERGTNRREQLDATRRLFVNSGVVLSHGHVRIPAEVRTNGLARRILDSVDGEKTIGEVLYHTHASEFLVLKFLASAVHSNFLAISEVREVDPAQPTLLDDLAKSAPRTEEKQPEQNEFVAAVPAPKSSFEEKIELAQHFLAQNEAEAALDVLDECYQQRPGDDFLAHVTQKAEAEFVNQCREEFGNRLVPVLAEGKQFEPSESPFCAAEKFLMGMMGDGHTIQTLCWVAPMRELDVYRALARMKNVGVITLAEGDEEAADAAPTVEWAQ